MVLKGGSFSVSSFYSTLVVNRVSTNPIATIWKPKAAPRVLAFGWLALRGRILIMDNLWRRVIVVNACPMCLEDESIDHLLLNWKIAQCFWNAVFGWFGSSWVLSKSFLDLLWLERCRLGLLKAKRCGAPPFWPLYGSYGRNEMLDVSMEKWGLLNVCLTVWNSMLPHEWWSFCISETIQSIKSLLIGGRWPIFFFFFGWGE